MVVRLLNDLISFNLGKGGYGRPFLQSDIYIQRNMKHWLICILILFSACNKYDNGFRIYTIKENRHRSVIKVNRTQKESFNIQVQFDESAQYTSQDPINQLDVNKLWGVSDCGSNHNKNSIRFGWRWDLDLEQIEILMYRRKDSEFSFKTLGYTNPSDLNYLSLSITADNYVMTLNGVTDSMSRSCKEPCRRYYLYPYFGGTERAPHDITIRIKEE